MIRFARLATALGVALACAAPALAQDKVLNLYSARHYQTDEQLYSNFTKETGIKINRIEAGDDQLLERLKSEGANSPADVFLLVDASRIENARAQGLFQPVKSKVLEDRIPPYLRDPDGNWFAFSTRARILIYNKGTMKAGDIPTYASLADPRNKGKVCARSGGHPYNISLIALQVAHVGEQKAQAWADGVVANFARKPQGGDTDQIKAAAAGQCGVAIANSYYYARILRSTKPEDVEIAQKTAVVWPNQDSTGTQLNISGGGVLKHAPNRDNAIKFLEYLASDQAQRYFADGNNEWPTAKGVKVDNKALAAMGGSEFKVDTTPVATVAKFMTTAQKIADKSGWR